jgi:beta-lactamase superfamily II metal-dependent hydrolase
MLTIHVLNVGHGSSIVVEHSSAQSREKFYGVIDSNCRANRVCPALSKLQELGAERISFLALTHPHKDHFAGMFDVITAYQDRIDAFFCFPWATFLSTERG